MGRVVSTALSIYEDLGTALRGDYPLDPLSVGFKASPETKLLYWRATNLREPFLKEQAAAEAAGVQALIVSDRHSNIPTLSKNH